MLKHFLVLMSFLTVQNLVARPSFSSIPLTHHYFIEILPNDSVVYGNLELLTDSTHRKVPFKDKNEFYKTLSHDTNTPSVLGDKTLVFFHGWLGFRHSRISKYVNTFDQYYTKTGQIRRTISIIWNTGNRTYGNSRRKVPEIALAFQKDFEELTNFIQKTSATRQYYLLCHSMGNFFFQQLFKNIKNPQPCFKEYILAAPDLDCNVFEKGQDFETLNKMVAQITLLQHRNDRTLRVSKILLAKNRLGRHGLTQPTPSVKTVDVTDIRKTNGFADGFTHHLYFYRCPEVITIIGQSFKEKEMVGSFQSINYF